LFNFATVPFYWEGTEPKQGELRYAEGSRDIWRRPPPDRYIPFARKHGITLKGHPLLWHAYNPGWLPKDAEALKRLYRKRFAEIAQRYAKDIKIWDVVNESLCSSKGKRGTRSCKSVSLAAWACC
jgi:GH35 family endo-1,4-beta-xylanase